MFSADFGRAPLLLGFAPGMRHALDGDHIVAMSTIVTRERSVVRAALPGYRAFFERLVGVMLIALRHVLSHAIGLTLAKVGDTIHKLKFCFGPFFAHSNELRGTSEA
ncbi:MAG: hypothetical protein ACM3PF_07155 [Bacteroidota bacterium]